jgi:hypothetical protein
MFDAAREWTVNADFAAEVPDPLRSKQLPSPQRDGLGDQDRRRLSTAIAGGLLACKAADPPDEPSDVARVDNLPRLDERDGLAGDVQCRPGVERRRVGAFEFGLHFGQRPKCSEELIDQFPFGRPRLKHGRRPGSLCSKFPRHTESSALWK